MNNDNLSLTTRTYPFIALGLLVIIIVRYLTRTIRQRRFAHQQGCKAPPKYPHKDPILGLDSLKDALDARKADISLKREHNLHEKYGYTYTSRFQGTWVVNTIEPDNIKAVLSTKVSDYQIDGRRVNAFAPLLGNSIFQNDGERWKASRSLLLPCFQRVQLAALSILEPHVSDLISNIPGDGTTLDLAPLFQRFTADVATDFMFGESINSLQNPEALEEGVMKALHIAQSGCELRWLLGNLTAIFPHPTFYKNVKIAHRYIQNYVDAVFARGEPKSNGSAEPKKGDRVIFLDQMRQTTQDRKILQDEILTLYFAGTETVAALLINLFFFLAKRPDVWGRLREEVQQLNGDLPDAQQLKGLEYVNSCIRESLRLHPAQPSNSRIASRDTVLPTGGGPDGQSPVFVPKGSMVHFTAFALHRRPDLWGDDAEQFRPERWANEKQSWKFIPFLKGPRNCIGMDFALIEATYVLTRLVQTFDRLESRDPGEWVEGSALALMSKNGAKVALFSHKE